MKTLYKFGSVMIRRWNISMVQKIILVYWNAIFFRVETGMVSQSKGLSNYVCYIKSSPWTNFNNSVFNWYGTANLKKH